MKFRDRYDFLSNFYSAPINVNGQLWPTVEHAFQGFKTTNLETRECIRNLPTPGQAKRAGRKLFMRKDWSQIKLQVMTQLVSAKFRQHPELAVKLMAVTCEIVEDNDWGDAYWGVSKGVGQNHLGRILMQVRDGGLK